jgi:hypothetical protein
MPSNKYLQNAKKLALLSFLLSTTIFIFYYFTSGGWLLFAGYTFIVIAGLVKLIILIDFLIKARKYSLKRKNKIYKTCCLMLLNIPFAVLYCWFTMVLLNIMRITLTNSTKAELTNIAISGCESKFIDYLKPGQSKEVWVKINGDCGIIITYLSNGQQKKEMVAGYVTNGLGEKLQYNIDGKIKSLTKCF